MAENAVTELTQARCDPNRLRALIHLRRQLLTEKNRERVRALLAETEQMTDAVKGLSATPAGLWVAPPLTAPTLLGRLTADLKELGLGLETWLDRSRRREVWQDYCLAMLCSYVIRTTGTPHDREIADLWGKPSAEAVRRFRAKHDDLIRLCDSQSSTAPAPPEPPKPA